MGTLLTDTKLPSRDADGFESCCPACYGTDFQPIELTHNGKYIQLQQRSGEEICGYCEFPSGHIGLHLEPYNGEELYHCSACGKIFEREQAIELKELKPVMI